MQLATNYFKTIKTVFHTTDDQLSQIPQETLTPEFCKRLLTKNLNQSIRQYLKANLKEIKLGKHRLVNKNKSKNREFRDYLRSNLHILKENRQTYHPSFIEVKLVFKHTLGYIGVYSRGKLTVKTPKAYWSRRLELYKSGEDRAMYAHFLYKTDMMNTLVHELTHLFQDICGDNFQNNAYFPGGKAIEDPLPPTNQISRYGEDILHFSRITEIISYAMEASFELYLRHPTYESALETLKSRKTSTVKKFNDLGKDFAPEDTSLILFERIRKMFYSRIIKNLSELYS